jgi:formate/nitrite transporter FocA (FNT family)
VGGNSESTRPSAGEILSRDAEEEICRPSSALAISGFVAGLLMGLSGTGVAVVEMALHSSQGWREAAAFTLYPLGFIAVIVGRAQLFTENTLYPVVLVLDRRERLLDGLEHRPRRGHLAPDLRLGRRRRRRNAVGGVVVVALLNYGQVIAGRRKEPVPEHD